MECVIAECVILCGVRNTIDNRSAFNIFGYTLFGGEAMANKSAKHANEQETRQETKMMFCG